MKPPETPADPRLGDRIAKLLARAGVASRREIERMIEDRRIALNGVPLETPATILKSLKGITVDGKPVAPPETARLFRYNKPTGLLVAERDFTGRPTIYDKLPKELPRVVPVGRLDLNTEGLLLLTNDGELKRLLELPATGIPRTYRARTYGPISQAQLEDLIEGVEIEGVRYGSINANLERRTGTNQWIELTLTEGKNREVRRVLEYLGLQVSRLIRTAYGPFPLADMPSGAVDEIKQNIVVEFMKNMKGMKPITGGIDSTRPVGREKRREESLRPRSTPPARPPVKAAEAPFSPRRARAANFGPKVEREAAQREAAAAPPAKRKHWREGPKSAAPVNSTSGKPSSRPGGSRPSNGPRTPRPVGPPRGGRTR